MRAAILPLAVIFLGLSSVAAQGPTFRQLAIEHKGRAGSSGIGCGWPGEPFPLIVKSADVVVYGTVLAKRTYATPDDRDIFTDFEVAPQNVIMQRLVVSSTRPGPARAMVFKTRGGTVVFDGYPFTLDVESNSKRVTLAVGDRAVLFGSYDAADGKWLLTPIGVFNLEDDVVINTLPAIEPFTETWPARMPINVFSDRIRSLAARLR